MPLRADDIHASATVRFGAANATYCIAGARFTRPTYMLPTDSHATPTELSSGSQCDLDVMASGPDGC